MGENEENKKMVGRRIAGDSTIYDRLNPNSGLEYRFRFKSVQFRGAQGQKIGIWDTTSAKKANIEKRRYEERV